MKYDEIAELADRIYVYINEIDLVSRFIKLLLTKISKQKQINRHL